VVAGGESTEGFALKGFSVERLMHFATVLEHEVVIEIRSCRSRGCGASDGGWGGIEQARLGCVEGRQRSGLRSMPTHRKGNDCQNAFARLGIGDKRRITGPCTGGDTKASRPKRLHLVFE
jgi:hypothetical protein